MKSFSILLFINTHPWLNLTRKPLQFWKVFCVIQILHLYLTSLQSSSFNINPLDLLSCYFIILEAFQKLNLSYLSQSKIFVITIFPVNQMISTVSGFTVSHSEEIFWTFWVLGGDDGGTVSLPKWVQCRALVGGEQVPLAQWI